MEKQIETITTDALLLLIVANELNNGSCEFVQFTAETYPKMTKKDRVTGELNPFGRVKKVTTTKAALKVNYQNRVNKVLENEGYQEKGENLFVAEALPYGKWADIGGKTSKILVQKEKDGKVCFDLRTTFFEGSKPESHYYLEDGTEIEKSKLVNFLDVPKTGEVCVVRNYGLGTMKEVRLNGVIYKIKNDPE